MSHQIASTDSKRQWGIRSLATGYIATSLGQRSLTLRLTGAGQQALIAILREWDARDSGVAVQTSQ